MWRGSASRQRRPGGRPQCRCRCHRWTDYHPGHTGDEGQAVAAAAFALELGNATFDASDADGNGIPDAVTLTLLPA
ncbi:MAG: hypothetical protein R3E79_39600 [Caldilineaceae bacterium]